MKKIILNKNGITLIDENGDKHFSSSKKLEYNIDDDMVYFNAPTSMSYNEFIRNGGKDIQLIFLSD